MTKTDDNQWLLELLPQDLPCDIHETMDNCPVVTLRAAITEKMREARIEGGFTALEKVLVSTGRWTDDSDLGIIQLSSNDYDRLIADEAMRLHDALEQPKQEEA